MKLNKIIPTALVALMGAGGLTGCGGGASGDVLTIWGPETEQAVLNDLLEKYNAQAADEDKISKFDYAIVSEADAGPTVEKNSSASNAPDLFLAADDQIYSLQSKNIAVNLTSTEYASDIKKNNVANAVAGASYNNKIYGFPVTNDNGYFLMYNSELLKDSEAGSLDTILSVAKSKEKHVMFDIENGYYAASLFLSPQVAGTDSLKFKENSNGDVIYDINWKDAKSVAAFDAMTKLFKTYKDNIIAATNANVVSELKDGTAVAAIFGAWVFDAVKAELGNELKVTKLPTFKVGTTDTQLASFTGSKIYVINSKKTDDKATERRVKAAKFAAFVTNKESQLTRYSKRGTIPCNKEALADKSYKQSDAAKALDLQNETASAVQAVCAEARYWDVGAAIGRAIKTNDLGSFKTTQAFLTGQCKILEEPAV